MLFVDTNILLYTLDFDRDAIKSERAREIFRRKDLAMSVQVLQEFYTQATRDKRPGQISHEDAVAIIERLLVFPIQAMTLQIFQSALFAKQRYQISYWDAAILEAARALGCDTVLSEDLGHGQNYGGVRVVNPFLPL